MAQATIKTGDNVLISPDLTRLPEWEKGTVIDIRDNPFRGIVISAETLDRNVFFGPIDLFKTAKNKDVCLQ